MRVTLTVMAFLSCSLASRQYFKMEPNPSLWLDLLQGQLPMKILQKKVSRQSGHVDLLLDVNHLYKQAEWNFFLHVLQAFLGRE